MGYDPKKHPGVRQRRTHAQTWTLKRRDAAMRHFVNDATQEGREDWSTRDLYRHYLSWIPPFVDAEPMSARMFVWTLRRLGCTVTRENGRNIVIGLSPRGNCADVHGAYVR